MNEDQDNGCFKWVYIHYLFLGSSSIYPGIARAELLTNPRQFLIEFVFLKLIQA